MRTVLFILILTLAASAQSPLVDRAFNAGTTAARSGNFEQGLRHYKTALAFAESEATNVERIAQIHYNIGVCHYRIGMSSLAIPELKKAIALRQGSYPEALYALGMSEVEQKNWPASRQAFLKALKADRSNGRIWFDLALVYLAEEDLENAEQALRRSIANSAVDSALSHNNLGVLLAMKGEVAEAAKEFELALLESGGRLMVAKGNLEFCNSLAYRPTRLTAGIHLKFAQRDLPAFLG